MTPDAISAMENPVTPAEITRDAPIVAEFVDYLRWLADRDTGYKIEIGNLWQLYYDGVRCCRYWSEVCEDLDLPVRDER